MKTLLILFAQFFLMTMLTVWPFFLPSIPLNSDNSTLIGGVLVIIGGGLSLISLLALKRNLTVHPKPKEDGELIIRFPFNISRNPIYLGLILAGIGWSIWNRSLVMVVILTLLMIVLNIKIKLEEKYLLEKFGDSYKKYLKRVRRYI